MDGNVFPISKSPVRPDHYTMILLKPFFLLTVLSYNIAFGKGNFYLSKNKAFCDVNIFYFSSSIVNFLIINDI